VQGLGTSLLGATIRGAETIYRGIYNPSPDLKLSAQLK